MQYYSCTFVCCSSTIHIDVDAWLWCLQLHQRYLAAVAYRLSRRATAADRKLRRVSAAMQRLQSASTSTSIWARSAGRLLALWATVGQRAPARADVTGGWLDGVALTGPSGQKGLEQQPKPLGIEGTETWLLPAPEQAAFAALVRLPARASVSACFAQFLIPNPTLMDPFAVRALVTC